MHDLLRQSYRQSYRQNYRPSNRRAPEWLARLWRWL